MTQIELVGPIKFDFYTRYYYHYVRAKMKRTIMAIEFRKLLKELYK